ATDDERPEALCVLALDIDNFKQVNDSYGHAYGDLVIKSFALRIDNALQAFLKTKAPLMAGVCAHVSGEEFFCIAWGRVESSAFEELADAILIAVRDQPLPSDSDRELLAPAVDKAEFSMPNVG